MYKPRKVFVLENDIYIELTYTEFLERKEADKLYRKKLFIPIQGYLMEADKENYQGLYREKERYRYLKKLDAKNNLLSIDALDNKKVRGEECIFTLAEDISEVVVNKLMAEKLRECLSVLEDDERELITCIYYKGMTERELRDRFQITHTGIHKRKHRILAKLRKLMES